MIFHKKIEELYKKQMFTRCDGNDLVKYFSHNDFPGLNQTEYSFVSSLGHPMKGYFYSYVNYNTQPLIIFEHGFGGGHLSYMQEIAKLCAAGFRVFTYDHTGCMTSGGTSTNGFAQSLHDLDDCLKALKKDVSIDTSNIAIMGHSWGGFSTLNISALHPDIKKIVVLSGFISVKEIIAQNFSGFLKGYQKYILAIEEKNNSEYVKYNAIETLKNSNVSALLIYSDNDHLVNRKIHYDALYQTLKNQDNIHFLLEIDKGHNPNYTQQAVKYLGTFGAALKKAKKLKTKEEKDNFQNSFDWYKMTEQDERVWEKIISFLK